jgi:hypothetical protein
MRGCDCGVMKQVCVASRTDGHTGGERTEFQRKGAACSAGESLKNNAPEGATCREGPV